MLIVFLLFECIFIVLDNIYCFVLCVMPGICWPEDNWGEGMMVIINNGSVIFIVLDIYIPLIIKK